LKFSQAVVCDSLMTAGCYSLIIYKTNGILLAIVWKFSERDPSWSPLTASYHVQHWLQHSWRLTLHCPDYLVLLHRF